MTNQTDKPEASEVDILQMIKLDLEILADEHLILEADKQSMSEAELNAHEELYRAYKRWSKNPEKFISRLSSF